MDNLQHAYSNLLTQGGQLLSNIGKGVSSVVGNVGNAVGNEFHQLTTPQIQSPVPQRQTMAPQVSPIQQFGNNVGNFLKPVGNFIGQQAQYAVQNKNSLGQPNAMPFSLSNPFAPAPRLNLPQIQTGNPIKNFVYNLPTNIVQGTLNAPSDLQKAIPQTVQDFKSGQIKNPRIAVADAADIALPALTLGTLGGGTVAKNLGEAAYKTATEQGLKQAIKEGATSGLKYGGGFGALQGFSSGRNITNPFQYALNLIENTGIGAATGTALGAGTGAVGGLIGSIQKAIAKQEPNISPAQVSQKTILYLRDRAGRYTGVAPKGSFETAGLNGKISTPGQPLGGNWMDQVDKQIGWDKNNQPSMGLAVKTLSKEEHLANQPAGGEPLPWENKQGQTLPEFASKEQNAGVKIPTDQASQQQAETRAVLESLGKVDSGTKQTFADWVNQRKATKVEGLLKQREFSDLNNKGINGIFEFQSGNKTGRFGDVKKYFDEKYQQVKDAGIELNYKKDYLPQLWNNTQQEVEQVFGRSLGTKPSFSMDSIIKNYEEGIKAGLTPKFSNIGELAGWYEQRANKAIADMNFFTKLGKDGFIQPSGKAPRDWVSLNPDTFPKVKTNINGETYNGVYKAPRELADMINNYLYSPANGNTFSRALNGIANFVSRAKNITLSFGVPNTGINAHGFNILARHTLGGTGGNPITRLLTGAKYMVHPSSAVAELDKTLATAPDAVKHGLTLSAEEHTALLNQGETLAKSLGKKWNGAFEKPLFNKMIPALKLDSYNQLTKNGMDGNAAAKVVNNVYGGINWEQMGRSRDVQNFLRTIILAPDWAESTVRLGGNLGKAFTPFAGETGARYRTMAATMLGSYVALNIANKLTSGHYAFQNDPGHTFELQVGYTQDGQKRYFRPYGTSVDFLRLPFDTAVGLAQGDPTSAFRAIRNRLSIPLGATMGLLTNTDYKGGTIYGQDKYGNQLTPVQSGAGIAGQVIGAAGLPSFFTNAVDSATGKQGIEQGLTQGFELPFRYTNIGHSNIAKQLDPYVSLQGKDLYDFNKQLQGQSKLSNNQIQGVNASPDKKQAIQGILDVRKMNSDETKLKNSLLNNQQSNSATGQAFAAEKVVNNKIYYTDNGTVKNIDLNPPTTGTGIDAYTNQNWQYSKARQIFAAPISDAQKQAAYQQLGVTPSQVEYDYKATKSNDIKSQYVLDKAATMSHQDLLNEMVKGRQESISGTQFASNTVIDSLNQAGYLSDAEAKGLKALKYDKNGNQVAKVSTGKKVSVPKIPTLKLTSPKTVSVKAPRASTYTLKAPKLKIPPIPRFGSSLPKAKKVRLSA